MSKTPMAASRLAAVDLGHAVVERGRDQVRPDQAVRGGAADEERSRAAARTCASARRRRARRSPPRTGCRRAAAPASTPSRRTAQARRRRAVAHEENDEREHEQQRDQRRPRRRPSASRASVTMPAEQRQEDELPGRVARGQHAGDEAAPARRTSGSRPSPRAGRRPRRWPSPIDDAPEQIELPRRGRSASSAPSRPRSPASAPDHPPHAEAVVAARPRTAPPSPNSTRLIETATEIVAAAPAELVLERHDQHARPSSGTRRRDQRTKVTPATTQP